MQQYLLLTAIFCLKKQNNFIYIYINVFVMYLLYFDPGLGAMIIQAVVAAVAGVVLFSKNLMYKIKSFLGLVKKDENEIFDDINIDDNAIENKKNSDL